METEIKQRDFATLIPAEYRRKWTKLKQKHPRVTRNIHIIASTGLSKPIITRAMTDNVATEKTLNKIDEFFNNLK